MSEEQPRRIGRSIGAMLAGMAVVLIPALATDAVLHATHFFPPVGESMVGYDWALLVATGYRTVYGVA